MALFILWIIHIRVHKQEKWNYPNAVHDYQIMRTKEVMKRWIEMYFNSYKMFEQKPKRN